MEMSKFRLSVIALQAATLIYAVALYQYIQRYEAWKQSYVQSHPDLAPCIDFAPYVATNLFAVFVALVLMLGWTVPFVYVWRGRNAQVFKTKKASG